MTDPVRYPFGLVLDCADPDRLAPFWSAALDDTVAGAAGSYVALYPRTGSGPKLLLQRVSETKTGKNRMHLDLDAEDIEVEAARLEALGARVVGREPCHEHGTTWLVMADPEGNEFCVATAAGAVVPRRDLDLTERIDLAVLDLAVLDLVVARLPSLGARQSSGR